MQFRHDAESQRGRESDSRRTLTIVAFVALVAISLVLIVQSPVRATGNSGALRLVDGQVPGDLLTIANAAEGDDLDDAIEIVDVATLLPGFVGDGINEVCVSTNGSVGLDSFDSSATYCDFYDTALSTVRDDSALLLSGTLLAPFHTDQKSTWTKNLGSDDSRTLDQSLFPLGAATDVVSVSAGDYHTCAVTSDGAVFCWGSGSYGRLGDGSATNRSTPVQVKGVGGEGFLSDVVSVSAGGIHSCAVTSDGAAFCWGLGGNGELGNGLNSWSLTPVQVKPVVGEGFLSDVVSVSAGGYHTCAVTSDGAAFCWGYGQRGRLGDGLTTNRSTPVQVKGVGGIGFLSDVVSVSAGSNHTCAVTSDGAAFCWGDGLSGKLGDGSTANRSTPVQVKGVEGTGTLSDVVSVSASSSHTCAVTSDGAVFCWGAGGNGELGNGLNSGSLTPVQVTGVGGEGFLSGVVSVASGFIHACAVTSDGAVFCWGSGRNGKLGNRSIATQLTPASVWSGGMPGNALTNLNSGQGTLSWTSDWFEAGDCVRFFDTGTSLDNAGSFLVSSDGDGTVNVAVSEYGIGVAPAAGYGLYSDCVGVPSTISVATDQLINGHRSVIVTWYRMPTFSSDRDLGSANTYQVVIIERGDDAFDVEYNYGSLTGDQFGEATNIPIGWVSKVTGKPEESHEWVDTINAAQLVDNGSHALRASSLNSNVAGRYVIPFREGVALAEAWTTPSFDGAATFAAGFLPASAPVDVVAVVSATSAEISWTPGEDGIADTTGYTVTASPGGATCSTTDTTCSIVGLTSGVAYTFSVIANTTAGDSDAGSVSATTPTSATSTTTSTSTTSTTVEPTSTTAVPTSTTAVPTSTTTSTSTTSTTAAVATPGLPSREQILSLPLATLTASAVMLPGSTFTATIGGFEAGDAVRLVVASDPQLLGSAVVDVSGTVTFSGVIPRDLSAGEHTLAVIDSGGSGFRQTIMVSSVVLPATGSTTPRVPFALLLLGLLIIFTARRRSHTES